MARGQRVWIPGAQFHVMCRGNRKREIFYCKEDYMVYMYILRNAKKAHPFEMISYCLMPNHVHLQIQTREESLATIMKYINQRYSMYINKEYQLVGHVFQGRYKCVEILDPRGCHAVSRYVHLNPVKAFMCGKPEVYRWTSYRYYLYGERDDFVDTGVVLDHYKDRGRYQAFVESGIKKKGDGCDVEYCLD